MALSKRDIKLLACTWAAPSWMKTNNSTLPGYISEKYQETWARYHIRFLEEYQKEDLSVWSLSGGNEMALLYVLPMQEVSLNCTLSLAPTQMYWLRHHLKPLLTASNFSQVKFLNLEDQRFFASYWIDKFADDQEAYEALDGLAIHWYLSKYIPVSTLDSIHTRHPEKLILTTEASINSGISDEGAVILGSWNRGEKYLFDIFESFDHWTSAYLDWNLALDLEGGPTLSSEIDASVIVNKTSGEFYKQPMFYAMGHFSKFVQPNSKKVEVLSNQNTSSPNMDSDILSKELLKKKLLSTRLPSSEKDVFEQIEGDSTTPPVVKALAFSNPDNSFTVMVLNTKNVTAQLKIEDPRVGVIALNVDEHSVYSFIYWP